MAILGRAITEAIALFALTGIGLNSRGGFETRQRIPILRAAERAEKENAKDIVLSIDFDMLLTIRSKDLRYQYCLCSVLATVLEKRCICNNSNKSS